MRKSHKVLKKAIDRIGVKATASKMHLSKALIYKWCQEHEPQDPIISTSGAANPLDRIQKLYEVTQDPDIINWVCQLGNGYFVMNPGEEKLPFEAKVVKNIQNMIKEFSETLGAISTSYNNDKSITLSEANAIRKEWEDLKRIGEGFVKACESGKFEKLGKKK